MRRLILLIFIISLPVLSDSFKYNSFNNHGVVGLINLPTARFYDESVFGFTAYDGNPDQKITMTSSPYDWMEASFFYTNIQGKKYCGDILDPVCSQDYKDKGFNLKVRLKKEGVLPAIAIGAYDIAGTGLYSSEYIIASYGIKNFDFHFGIGWGNLNQSKNAFRNPFTYIDKSFKTRDRVSDDRGGQFQPSRYFSGSAAAPLFGLSYVISDSLIMKIEADTTVTPGRIGYEQVRDSFSYSFEYKFNDNLNLGFNIERGGNPSLRFVYKEDPLSKIKKYSFKPSQKSENDNQYSKLIKNLNSNGLEVNKIVDTPDFIALEVTQFTHPNLDVIEEIITFAKYDAGIDKVIKKELKIASMSGIKEYKSESLNNAKLIYERPTSKRFSTNTNFKIRPFFAAREGFFKWSLLLENDSEFIIKDNFFFNSNIKYSLKDNFDDLNIPPKDTYPAQVRSDVKDYLRNIDEGIIIGRAQFDYHINPRKDHHVMLTAGILEEMFLGYGLEYLYFNEEKNYGIGFEIFEAQKRDHMMKFGTLDYKNTTAFINYYYRNYDFIPFDLHISHGEYLAGDIGTTIELSRKYLNGMELGVFATFTDVSSEQFGEGAFDKGIFFNIPIYGNFINYTWRPLTKDPGAKLNRRNTLHDLLLRFRPYH